MNSRPRYPVIKPTKAGLIDSGSTPIPLRTAASNDAQPKAAAAEPGAVLPPAATAPDVVAVEPSNGKPGTATIAGEARDGSLPIQAPTVTGPATRLGVDRI